MHTYFTRGHTINKIRGWLNCIKNLNDAIRHFFAFKLFKFIYQQKDTSCFVEFFIHTIDWMEHHWGFKVAKFISLGGCWKKSCQIRLDPQCRKIVSWGNNFCITDDQNKKSQFQFLIFKWGYKSKEYNTGPKCYSLCFSQLILVFLSLIFLS